MECDVCETIGRKKFFCEVCLNERLLIHNSSLKRLGAAHETTVQRAAQLLDAPEGVQERRILKAKRAALIIHAKHVEAQREKLIENCESNRFTLQAKKKQLATRQIRLREAQAYLKYQTSKISKEPNHIILSPSPPVSSCGRSLATPQFIALQKSWDEVLQNLVDVRRKLISQLFAIYTITLHRPRATPRYPNINHTGSSPSNGLLSFQEWRILGLCLPVSTEIKTYHHEEISAAALYASHLVRLSAMYLGIKLPFQMTLGPILSVRAPRYSIWSHKHPSSYPLHIPTAITSTSYSGSSVTQVAFLTGLCMLAHNAYYLALAQNPTLVKHSHSSSIGASNFKPCELLQNLYLCYHSPQLGHFSHATGKIRLPRPDDFANSEMPDLQETIKEVLQTKLEDTVDEEWNLV
ncbi:hypothetical protein O181_061673 [Austropuccinia psidii MF-1]|uniref:Autophagy-related protein 14 n=1 Tax=Austropuccinia psidii MF-1 TaxID=1389203 RepID=A0A9Q3EIF9_9BASI|nr:hypothetical protein [Austropuccinia psidii MF-1]